MVIRVRSSRRRATCVVTRPGGPDARCPSAMLITLHLKARAAPGAARTPWAQHVDIPRFCAACSERGMPSVRADGPRVDLFHEPVFSGGMWHPERCSGGGAHARCVLNKSPQLLPRRRSRPCAIFPVHPSPAPRLLRARRVLPGAYTAHTTVLTHELAPRHWLPLLSMAQDSPYRALVPTGQRGAVRGCATQHDVVGVVGAVSRLRTSPE
ncbi:hypothetical protein FB451DRAFT_1554207 [Mycena latifolia]|nr:hypothetical protein FB451DRAFT_1554207 [Mycena latifolia]